MNGTLSMQCGMLGVLSINGKFRTKQRGGVGKACIGKYGIDNHSAPNRYGVVLEPVLHLVI